MTYDMYGLLNLDEAYIKATVGWKRLYVSLETKYYEGQARTLLGNKATETVFRAMRKPVYGLSDIEEAMREAIEDTCTLQLNLFGGEFIEC
tara:strand:+ start:26546 stop:26818 length:273 start_codon:yes stop_codon:yes gene_type:complete